MVAGRITACKHANGRDWWLVVHQYHSGLVYKYLISPQGISGPTTQDLFTYRDVYFGQAVFSPQGTKFAYYEPYGDLDIFDFDRCTGDFSNFVHIDINDSAFAGGAAFSPSGRFLYLSSIYYIYQFDLLSPNIDSSKIVVGVYDGYREQGLYQNFYLSALAPDGKIYTNCGDGSKYLHVINSPDSAGLACNFVQRGFPLPRWNAFTIPNFPNYFLSAQGGTVCDSLLSAVATVEKPREVCHFSPNPSSGIVQLTYSLNTESTLEITNSLSSEIRTVQLSPSANSLTLDLSKSANGIYFYRIYNSTTLLSTGKLIVTQ